MKKIFPVFYYGRKFIISETREYQWIESENICSAFFKAGVPNRPFFPALDGKYFRSFTRFYSPCFEKMNCLSLRSFVRFNGWRLHAHCMSIPLNRAPCRKLREFLYCFCFSKKGGSLSFVNERSDPFYSLKIFILKKIAQGFTVSSLKTKNK